MITEEIKESILQLEISLSKGHLSQHQIAQELQISKGNVFNILKESRLKCCRKVQCQQLAEIHRNARREKAQT